MNFSFDSTQLAPTLRTYPSDCPLRIGRTVAAHGEFSVVFLCIIVACTCKVRLYTTLQAA